MGEKLQLAVVGIGRISTAHIRGILNNEDISELAAVMSRNEEKVKQAAEVFGVSKMYTSYQEVLEDPEIDGIVLCTPNKDHYSQTLAALRAGKHVLVEKPMAMDRKEALEMQAVAEQQQKTLMVAHCRRFFNAIEQAKQRLGDLGTIIDTTHFLGVQFGQVLTEWWNDMEHLIIELNAPHPLDTTLYLLDEMPETVYAVGGKFSDQLAGTTQATIVLTFPSGKTATVHLSFHCTPPRNERIIIGTEGTMRISDEKDLWVNDRQVVSEDYGNYLEGGINFDRQIREFCMAIRESREPIASGREIIRLMGVLEAVKRSLDLKRIIGIEEIL